MKSELVRISNPKRTKVLYRICRICRIKEGGHHKMSCNFSKYNLPYEWKNVMGNEPEPEHDETDDEAPPQYDDSPAREGGHDE